MAGSPDRDRQPSSRYIERLADKLVPQVIERLDEYLADVTPATMKTIHEQLWWAVMAAAKDVRVENAGRD